jgi:hypothetical protein
MRSSGRISGYATDPISPASNFPLNLPRAHSAHEQQNYDSNDDRASARSPQDVILTPVRSISMQGDRRKLLPRKFIPLLATESSDEFEELRAKIGRDFNPQNEIARIYSDDVVNLC